MTTTEIIRHLFPENIDEAVLAEIRAMHGLDEELDLARLLLRRVLELEKEADEASLAGHDDQNLRLVEEQWTFYDDGNVDHVQVGRRIDWMDIIIQLLGQIGDLELRRFLLAAPERA